MAGGARTFEGANVLLVQPNCRRDQPCHTLTIHGTDRAGNGRASGTGRMTPSDVRTSGLDTSERRRRTAVACGAALAWHIAMAVFVATLSRRVPPKRSGGNQPLPSRVDLVWLDVRGPGGGGGGGGNRQQAPARALERAGPDKRNVPTSHSAPNSPRRPVLPEPKIVDTVVIPAVPLGASLEDLPGLIETAPAAPTTSQGPGRDGGAGPGAGTGSGPGRGPGVGPGYDGGEGGDAYRPGNGVEPPIPVHIERPRYTNDAMRARVQGVVWVECVVRPTGACSDIHVVRSIDPPFGLDEEAMKAAALWRFKPGTRLGRPVPVIVRIQLEFSVR